MEAYASGPDEVVVTFTLTSKEAEDLATGFDMPTVEEQEIFDAVREAQEWELEKRESEALKRAEERAEKAQEWDHGGADW